MHHEALILFAHGSRDPSWSTPLERLRDTLAGRRPGPIQLAYAELQAPNLGDAIAALAATGTVDFVVVPVFFGPGRHVRDDLPAAVSAARAALPAVTIRVTGTLGDEPAVLAGLADGIARAAANVDE